VPGAVLAGQNHVYARCQSAEVEVRLPHRM